MSSKVRDPDPAGQSCVQVPLMELCSVNIETVPPQLRLCSPGRWWKVALTLIPSHFLFPLNRHYVSKGFWPLFAIGYKVRIKGSIIKCQDCHQNIMSQIVLQIIKVYVHVNPWLLLHSNISIFSPNVTKLTATKTYNIHHSWHSRKVKY